MELSGAAFRNSGKSHKCQEISAVEFNKKEITASSGKVVAGKSLARYQDAGLESAAYELVDIWFEVRSYSSVFKEAANAMNESRPFASESMDR